MATRASSKKEPSQKAKPKADLPAEKVAAPQPPLPPQPATDLISPGRKKSQTEARSALKTGVPPISKSKQSTVAPVPVPAVEPAAEPPPPPKPESVSLIDESRSKRSESSGAEPKIKSVLPPISKIRPPILTKLKKKKNTELGVTGNATLVIGTINNIKTVVAKTSPTKMKPSERIKEIHRAMKILDGQNPDNRDFENMSFQEKAIVQYLDELAEGTAIENRSKTIK